MANKDQKPAENCQESAADERPRIEQDQPDCGLEHGRAGSGDRCGNCRIPVLFSTSAGRLLPLSFWMVWRNIFDIHSLLAGKMADLALERRIRVPV